MGAQTDKTPTYANLMTRFVGLMLWVFAASAVWMAAKWVYSENPLWGMLAIVGAVANVVLVTCMLTRFMARLVRMGQEPEPQT